MSPESLDGGRPWQSQSPEDSSSRLLLSHAASIRLRRMKRIVSGPPSTDPDNHDDVFAKYLNVFANQVVPRKWQAESFEIVDLVVTLIKKSWKSEASL